MAAESKLERYLIEQVQKFKGETRKVKWIGRRNCPDRIVMSPTGVFSWVEMKAPGKIATQAQIREHKRLRDLKQPVVTLSTILSVDIFLKRIFNGSR